MEYGVWSMEHGIWRMCVHYARVKLNGKSTCIAGGTFIRAALKMENIHLFEGILAQIVRLGDLAVHFPFVLLFFLFLRKITVCFPVRISTRRFPGDGCLSDK
jgi:hypothetical protein